MIKNFGMHMCPNSIHNMTQFSSFFFPSFLPSFPINLNSKLKIDLGGKGSFDTCLIHHPITISCCIIMRMVANFNSKISIEDYPCKVHKIFIFLDTCNSFIQVCQEMHPRSNIEDTHTFGGLI